MSLFPLSSTSYLSSCSSQEPIDSKAYRRGRSVSCDSESAAISRAASTVMSNIRSSSVSLDEFSIHPISSRDTSYDHELLLGIEKTIREFILLSKRFANGYKKDLLYIESGIWSADIFFKACQYYRKETTLKVSYLIDNNNFIEGCASKSYFEHVRDPKTNLQVPYTFRVKKDVLPSKALKSFFENFSICDSALLYSIALHKAFLDLLGKFRFNYLFQGEHRMVIGDTENLFAINPNDYSLINRLVLFQSRRENLDGVKPGSLCYFRGVTDFSKKHRFGFGKEMYTICVDSTPGKELFIGFGLDLRGESGEAIRKKMLNAYNTPPSWDKFLNEKHREFYKGYMEESWGERERQAVLEDIPELPTVIDLKVNNELVDKLIWSHPGKVV